ncbi:MAG: NAD(P)H-dependent oxidoreductase [Oscillospiraceae bacterium]|nr:NAD(P)H-dependent oxidoreductase [Oscillospiraceae bacterium]
MHLILHDLPQEAASKLLPAQGGAVKWFGASPAVKPCVGCFCCWLKNPGECIIPDRGQQFCHLLAKADAFTIVSRCFYGGLSPDVKATLDRFIGHVLPWFTTVNGEMHHVPRYDRKVKLTYHLYGDITEPERETALRLAAANAVNLHAARHTVRFYAEADELEVL